MPQEIANTLPQWRAEHVCTADQKSLTREILTRLGDKWTMLVVSTLADGPERFTALLAGINGISHRMLTVTLRALERDGLVTRTAYAEVPPRVEYELTPLGMTLIEPLVAVIDWVDGHHTEVRAKRDAFDA
jgi:DNA-binding HxlR family transcriptional regulator